MEFPKCLCAASSVKVPDWPEECHQQRLLQCQAGGHGLANQARHFLVGQRPLIVLDRVSNDQGLALRLIVARGLVGVRFRLRDLQCQFRPLIDQFHQGAVDRVDFAAQVF